jgi:hypothetical protein
MSENKIGWAPLKFDFSFDDDDDYDDDDDDELFDDDEGDDEDSFSGIDVKLPKLLMTPIGPFKVDDTLNPFRHFEFWIGYANFNLSPKIVKVLEQTPGVEILNVITRYSFVIGVGKMFNFRDVRTTIEKDLCGTKDASLAIENVGTKNILLDRYERLAKNKYWAVIVLPNGNVDEVVAEDVDEDFLTMLKLFKESRDNCNSQIFCSHKELLEDGKTS